MLFTIVFTTFHWLTVHLYTQKECLLLITFCNVYVPGIGYAMFMVSFLVSIYWCISFHWLTVHLYTQKECLLLITFYNVYVPGIGYAMFMVSFLVSIYYNVIIAWTFYFLFSSFTKVLPWQTCGNEWNTPGELHFKCIYLYRGEKRASILLVAFRLSPLSHRLQE